MNQVYKVLDIPKWPRSKQIPEAIWEEERLHFLCEWNKLPRNWSVNYREEHVTEVLRQPFERRHPGWKSPSQRQWGHRRKAWIRKQTFAQNTNAAANQFVPSIALPAQSNLVQRNATAIHAGHPDTDSHVPEPSLDAPLGLDFHLLESRPDFLHYEDEGFSWEEQSHPIGRSENNFFGPFDLGLPLGTNFENAFNADPTTCASSAEPEWARTHTNEQAPHLLCPDVWGNETVEVPGAASDVNSLVATTQRPMPIHGPVRIPMLDIVPEHGDEGEGDRQVALDALNGREAGIFNRDDNLMSGGLQEPGSPPQTPNGGSVPPPNSASPKRTTKKRSRPCSSLVSRSGSMIKRLSDSLKRLSFGSSSHSGSPETKHSPNPKRLRLEG